MKTLQDTRSAFIDFYVKNGHQHVTSSSTVPSHDPTLMFTNAGMNQFKDIFIGKETRDYTRAVSSQKCVRAGGKHNDLENVGYTARHHTFFEMLGNFSFGDYFKEEAIKLAWDMVTKEYGLSQDKLLVTIYHNDEEAYQLWQKIAGLSDDRIVRIATSDNFWSMGDTGPCGPCTEIFYDHGDDIAGGPPGSPDEDGDRFIEIWNLVFMQYNQLTKKQRVDLPKPSIDTGMGLERITAILQGKHNNYEIDLFGDLISDIAERTHTKSEGEALMSHRVIADHLRASSFLIADGVLPSNEGRGYVLRRIMRRAMRHVHILGSKDPLMYQLVPNLVDLMGVAYPELQNGQATIENTLQREEVKFRETLGRGMRLLDDEISSLSDGGVLSGYTAFKLYDTYGFPLDLTADILRQKGYQLDEEGFDAAMAGQKAQARANWSGSGDSTTDEVWFNVKENTPSTQFTGYDRLQDSALITALVKGGQQVQSAQRGDQVAVITDKTPFYAQSGGQAGDSGEMINAEGDLLSVKDTRFPIAGVHTHFCYVEAGSVAVGDTFTLSVDQHKRQNIAIHHSATHLLHEALRQELGDHVAQKGSEQTENRTRFDISHPEPITHEQLVRVAEQVNHYIRQNGPVTTAEMSLDQAKKRGARALFGEKYSDHVRVVSMGLDRDQAYSVELCGGTHVKHTGEIGFFKIISETGVSAGVRRIEAVTGLRADQFADQESALLDRLADKLKTTKGQLEEYLDKILQDRKSLEKQVSELRQKLATGGRVDDDAVEEVNGVQFIGKMLENMPAKELKPMVDTLKDKVGSGIVVLVANNDGKGSIVVGVTDDLTARFSAIDLVRVGAQALGGKGGGGRPDMAQAGGPDGSKANDALVAVKGAVA